MLLELHVRNLALIEKADVEFGEGLNILTGETGAGKSIIIGFTPEKLQVLDRGCTLSSIKLLLIYLSIIGGKIPFDP